MMSVPVMSEGMRSGVNWMRLKLSPSVCAIVRTISVFAVPGIPVIRQWPPTNSAIKHLVEHIILPHDHLAHLRQMMPSRTVWKRSIFVCNWAAS